MDGVLLRIASKIYVLRWGRSYRWEELRDAIQEQNADELLRMGERDLAERVAEVMAAWERQKFEAAAVEAGMSSAQVSGVL